MYALSQETSAHICFAHLHQFFAYLFRLGSLHMSRIYVLTLNKEIPYSKPPLTIPSAFL